MSQVTYPPPATGEARPFVEDFYGYLGILRRGWHYIAVSILVCLTVAALYLVQLKSVYKGSARLLMLQQGSRPLGSVVANSRDPLDSLGNYDETPTHIMIIRSPAILERAIALTGMKALSLQEVNRRLTVTRPDPMVKIIEIGYPAATADEATKVIDAVVTSYKKFLEEHYQKNSTDVITLLARVRDELSQELKDLERKYLEFHQRHPVYAVGANGHSLLARRLDQWDAAANESMLRAVKLHAQLDLARKLNEEGAGLGTIGTTLRYLGDEKEDGPIAGLMQEAPDGSSEQVGVQLAEVERQRRTSERLLDHLRVEHAAATAARPVSEREVAEAFYADTEAARLREQLAIARGRRDAIQRTVRSPGDPSLVQVQRRVKALQDELGRLWQRRLPAIVELLGRGSDSEVESAIRREETNLIVLRSRESVLREELEEIQSGSGRLFGAPGVQLASPSGPTIPAPATGPRPVDAGPAVMATAATSRPALGPGRPDQIRVRAMLDSIERGLKANETMRAEMDRRFKEDLAAGKEAEIDRLEEENLRANLERERTLFNSVVDQLKQAQLVSDHSTITAQVVNPTATVTIRPRRALVLAAALVLGCGLGIGCAFLADLFDDRLRTLADLRRSLDFSMLGLIPQLPGTKTNATNPVGLISHALPRSLVAEAYKSIRTNLDFHRRNRPVQVLLITSPNSGDGKSTSASNLAISMAHAGRKVLLVDADLRRPSLHEYFGRDRARGLVLVLKDLMPVTFAAQETPVENLDLMASGPDVSNPAELLASPRFAAFLDEVRSSYDTIIIDSSPLLAVTDPLIIGSVIDGIILVARAGRVHRHEAERISEMLNALGTPVLGTVINGITRDQMGYRYGYGYGCGYGYGYGYGSRADDGIEPHADPPQALEHAASNLSARSTSDSPRRA